MGACFTQGNISLIKDDNVSGTLNKLLHSHVEQNHLFPNEVPIGNLQGAIVLIRSGQISIIPFRGWFKIRLHVIQFPRVGFHVGGGSPTIFYGIVDVTRWNLHVQQNMVGEAQCMETNPKSPTLVLVSPRNRQCHDTCPWF